MGCDNLRLSTLTCSFVVIKWIILLINISWLSSAATTPKFGSSKLQKEMYLAQFGYITLPDKGNQTGLGRSMTLDTKEISNGIKLFQEKNGLNVTGIFDEATMKKMQQPRCGVRDIQTRSMFGKWRENNLKYKFIGPVTHHLSEKVVKAAIQSAFDYWAQVTPLTFREVFDEEKAHFIIKFNKYTHDDEFPFDGPDGTLAHAFFPTDGRIHFDSDETFTDEEDRGYNLRIVAAHEIGHAIGLPHSYDPEALMAAFYAGYTPKSTPLLNENDIQSIQNIYGTKPISSITPKASKSTKARRTTKIFTETSTTRRITTMEEPTTTTESTTTQELSTTEESTTTEKPTTTEESTTTEEPTTTEESTTTEEPTNAEESTTTEEPTTTEKSTTTEEPTTTTEPTTTETTTTEETVTEKISFYTEPQWAKIIPGESEPDVCSSTTKISTVFMGKDGHMHLIIRYKDIQWIYQHKMVSSIISSEWPKRFETVFKNFPSLPLIDAAFYSSISNKFYFFSGTKLFITDDFGYFQSEKATGKDVSYAFNTGDKNSIVVTKDNMAWNFDVLTLEFKSSKQISEMFPGIPDAIENAAEDYPWHDNINFVYFFKGREYYKYNVNNKRRISSGQFGDSFFGCKQYPVPKLR